MSGNHAWRLFDVGSGGNLTLQDITTTKGYADGDGGAIYSSGTLNIHHSKFLDNTTSSNGNGGAIISFGTLAITNSEFADNQAANGGALYPTGAAAVTTITGSNFHDNQTTSTTNGWGGAIYMSAGAAVTISASTLSTNHARWGGAVYIYQISSLTQLTVNNSTLNGNSATYAQGGGILNNSGTAMLTNVTLSDNRAINGAGGGIENDRGTTTLTNVTLSGNSAYFGGGIYTDYGSTITLTNVTLSGNYAYAGGGIYNEIGTAVLTNVTLSGNSATAEGGGIYTLGGTATLKNTVIAKGASGENCFFDPDSPLGGSFNLSDDNSCNFAAGGGRDNVTDLLLGPLANNGGPTLTHMPQPDSPVRDSGTGAGCPATDQRGASRVGVGTACDVGSVEYGAILPWLYLPLLVR